MYTIAIANQKGGCGKTTTAINLSACLAYKGKRSVLIDMDPQAHATVGLQTKSKGAYLTIHELLLHPHKFRDTMDKIGENICDNLDIIQSSTSMTIAEQDLTGGAKRDKHLLDAISGISQRYDYVIIDCPPSMGILTQNAIMACDEVIITVETSFLALNGVGKFLEAILNLLGKRTHEMKLRVLATMYDRRTSLSREVLKELSDYFGDMMFNTVIARNIKLAESLSFGVPITLYDKKARGFADYMALAEEVIAENGSGDMAGERHMDRLSLLCQLFANGKSTADKLRATGYDTLERLLNAQVEQLSGDAQLKESTARKLIYGAAEILRSSIKPADAMSSRDDKQAEHRAEQEEGVSRDEAAMLSI